MRTRLRSSILLALLAATLACGAGSTGDGDDSGQPGGTGGTTDPIPASDPVATAILQLHNAARAAARPVPSPALAPLTWSAAAASAAQAWANGCVWPHDPKLESLGMGQNVFAKGSTDAAVAATPGEVVGSWVDEAALYDYASNTCSGEMCGHYTQVVWRSTTGVGCGHKVCHTGSPFDPPFSHWDFWVCNYVPAGNYVGERPY